MINIEPTMFREYDIRGRENSTELNPATAALIGKGYASLLKRRGIGACVVGHDNRSTSQEMQASLIDALVNSGMHVFDIGLSTTPIVYWSQYYLRSTEGIDVKGAAVVTASHNPVGWNGMKLATGYSQTLQREEVQEIWDIIQSQDFVTGDGKVEKRTVLEAYRNDLVSRINVHHPVKVVLNTGNGTAGAFTPQVLKEAGFEVIEHLTELDSSYPHYTPNPADDAMMEDTGRIVRMHSADIGIAIDADGDRLGVTDEKGAVIWPDRYMILLSRQALEEHPGSKIVFDVKCSNALPEDIEAHGGVPIMWKTGHSFIKQKIVEEGAVFGGEMSGHIFFVGDYYGFDDATFGALKMLEYLSRSDRTLSKIMADTPNYISTPTYTVEVFDHEGVRGDVRKYEIAKELAKIFKEKYSDVVEISGARVTWEDGTWGLVRPSSNLPQLGLRFESKTENGLEAIQAEFREILRVVPGLSSEWVVG